MRICIFGGSFNPLHNGHIALAQAVLDGDLADEIWLMVSPQNPLKEQGELLPEHLRLELARIGVDECFGISVSDFEFHLPRPSYTWKTLKALSETYPEDEFSLLIGGDNWAAFDRWVNPEYILQHHSLIIYPREGSPLCEKRLPPRVSLLHAPLFPVSSTQVRQLLREGGDVSSLIPKAELEYIKQHRLYFEKKG